jgi:phospholipase C
VAKGFIPVGWYPTSVRVSPDGKFLLVANGKGAASKANRDGSNPTRKPAAIDQHIAGLFRGTLSVIPVPKDDALARLSTTAYACSPLRADLQPVRVRPRDNPVPGQVGEASPIRYVIYIIKENRTYDQVLGDMPEGHGDPTLCLFGEDITPNQHALAREFVLLDNFYAEAEVSADGHEWSMGAYATDFVEKMWPLNYSGRDYDKIGYPAEAAFKIGAPSAGYLWDRCAAAGVTYRSYGEFIKRSGDKLEAKLDVLRDHFDPEYEPFNMGVLDAKRADRFIANLNQFEAAGEMPRFQTLHLPRDHTVGTRADKPTPQAMVAENDLALGRIVGAISRSRFWPQTVIFVVEDDAQNGSDHIDVHRTIAQVISPYVRRGTVDSTLYSTTSMLRTMELILGLEPLSQFDAAARPMYTCFAPRADVRKYTARPARIDLEAKNTAVAWGAAQSEEFDFTREDAADDLAFNEVIWRSVRGADSPMPPPVRAAFVLSWRGGEQDDDDD